MKTALTPFALAALLGAATFNAQAAEPTSAPASLTRAEVRAEFLRARAAGELPSPAEVYGPTLLQAMNQSASVARRQPATIKTADAAPAQVAAASAAR